MPTAREIDENGFLIVRACPISSFGIFDYGAGQLGLPGDPMRIVKVYRPEEAVREQDAIDSFKNVPLIDDHEMLSGLEGDPSASAPEDKGVDGVLTANVYYESPWMRGDLKVFSREMQEKINKGKRDLSLGYSCKFEVKPGTFDGQPYEVVQTELRGNHIALVGEGRVPGARVLDGLCFDHLSFEVKPSDRKSDMSQKAGGKKPAMDNAIAQLKALLPALEQFLNEEAQEPSHQGEGAGADPQANPAGAAADPVVDPAAGEAAPNPAASTTEDAPDVNQLIKNVEDVLSQLKGMQSPAGSAAGNGGNPTGDDDGTDPKDMGDDGTDPNAMDDGQPAGVEHNGKASPGPAAGSHAMAGDAAMKKFYADAAEKGRTYERLSKVVGAFDSASMTAKQVHEYGAKKLGLKCAPGQEHVALDAYLTGIEAAAKVTKVAVKAKAADSKGQAPELEAYLEGK